MKVLFVTTSYPVDHDDPRGNHVRVLAEAVSDAGEIVSLIAPGRRNAPSTSSLNGIPVDRFNYWPGGGSLTTNVAGILPALSSKPWLAIQIPPLVASMARQVMKRSTDMDVIHAHWLYPAGTASVLAGRRHGIPVVITVHGGDAAMASRNRVVGRAAVWTANRADKVLAVSDAIAEDLIRLGVEEDRVAVTPLGVPLAADVADVTGSPAEVLFVGSLIDRKGVDILLEVAADLPSESVKLTIVGDGPLEAEVRKVADANGAVEALGVRPPSEVASLMLKASALVLPSRSEGRPFVIMEAMAAGLPVIATDIPGSRELVQHETTGLLCEVNAASLRSSIMRLAEDESLRSRLGQAGRQKLIDSRLTAADAAERVRGHYRSLRV
ncbi:MAG: glycosyltransferase [Acidimicrobiia bacterium]|nr:glycosyltransferase [Acidimicrobiia bacterium]